MKHTANMRVASCLSANVSATRKPHLISVFGGCIVQRGAPVLIN